MSIGKGEEELSTTLGDHFDPQDPLENKSGHPAEKSKEEEEEEITKCRLFPTPLTCHTPVPCYQKHPLLFCLFGSQKLWVSLLFLIPDGPFSPFLGSLNQDENNHGVIRSLSVSLSFSLFLSSLSLFLSFLSFLSLFLSFSLFFSLFLSFSFPFSFFLSLLLSPSLSLCVCFCMCVNVEIVGYPNSSCCSGTVSWVERNGDA